MGPRKPSTHSLSRYIDKHTVINTEVAHIPHFPSLKSADYITRGTKRSRTEKLNQAKDKKNACLLFLSFMMPPLCNIEFYLFFYFICHWFTGSFFFLASSVSLLEVVLVIKAVCEGMDHSFGARIFLLPLTGPLNNSKLLSLRRSVCNAAKGNAAKGYRCKADGYICV